MSEGEGAGRGTRDDTERPVQRPPPRGCNPLVFGVVMATVQMAVLIWLLFWR